MSSRISPRPNQLQALAGLAKVYRSADRAQLRMACGTGKTLIGLWHARRCGARTVLLLEPSIALVAQTIRAWEAAADVPLRTLAVCSDPTTAQGRAEIGEDGWDPYGGQHERAGVTTRAEVLAHFLDAAHDATQGLTVVVSTYHSSEVITEALRLTDRVRGMDLLVADEAHRLAGRPDRRFAAALRDTAIRARQRLFQTATPIVLSNLAGDDQFEELASAGITRKALSMDDHRIFGPIAYELSAGEAIERGLLADYRVVVAQPAAGHGKGSLPERAAYAALVDTVGRYQVRRVLTFHNRVASARAFADRLTAGGTIAGIPVRAFAVDGSTPDDRRREILNSLGDDRSDEVIVVASSQVLREGVDVPAVDAAVFADPRSSAVSIVQAVGRVLRTHPGKTTGTVVIPLVLDDSGDDQEQLADSAYAHVWRVLRGLRAHDARIAFALDRARASVGANGTADRELVPWLHVSGDDPGTVLTRLLERSSPAWELYYGLLAGTVERLGSATAILAGQRVQGRPLGQWIVGQRILYRDRSLDPDRIRRLEAVPGWKWSAAAAGDDRTLEILARLSRRTGTVAENPAGPSAYRGLKDGLHRPLGRWIATQVATYHDGNIDSDLAEALEQLPGWTWHPLQPEDETALAAFRRFIAWEGHADVPPEHVEDNVTIGAWLGTVRRRKLLKVLPPALEDAIIAAAPNTGPKRARAFNWHPNETWWELGVAAACSYADRVGTLADMPAGYEEILDGRPVRLYQWLSRIKYLYRRGQLDEHREAVLNELPGWTWSAPRAGRREVELGEQLELGDMPHGRRGFYAGCRCAECVIGQRAYQTAAARVTRERRQEDWVACGDATNHLQCADGVGSAHGSFRSDRLGGGAGRRRPRSASAWSAASWPAPSRAVIRCTTRL